MATITGGVFPSRNSQNSVEVENLGRFAVDEHNKKENGMIEFMRVVKAAEQVVAGMLHHLTVEAIDAGKKKLYEAKVWVKPWMNFKELQEFKHAGDVTSDDSPSFTVSDLGVKQGHIPGLQSVLKVKRGDKEEKFKVEVHHKSNGAFHLNSMVPDHS